MLRATPSLSKGRAAGARLKRYNHHVEKRPDLGAEHQTLKRQVAELQREHEALERKSGFDRREHAEHRRKLQRKLTELRAHLARLKAGGGGPRR